MSGCNASVKKARNAQVSFGNARLGHPANRRPSAGRPIHQIKGDAHKR